MVLPTHKPDADLHDDDIPVGRILSRREVLALLGFTGATSVLAACQPAGLGAWKCRAAAGYTPYECRKGYCRRHQPVACGPGRH